MVVLDQLANKRITTNDPVVVAITDAAKEFKSNVSLRFLEVKRKTTKHGNWVEYNFVLDCKITSDTVICLASKFQEISNFLKKLTDLNISGAGIQEVKCDDYSHLCFGMYILKDVGQERNIPDDNMTKEIINLIENDEI